MENWLSLFDGMSCLQIAAKELGISPKQYYASEIDQHAIKQTQLNFPDTIQLGSVTEWETWDIDWSKIDLIGAGSPCQGFSFAGKQLAFDDPRSVLFFVFIDILNHCRKFNPNVKFLLENVDMKRKHMNVINNYCGLFAVNINSNKVSAQNRNRWYWSNIRTKLEGFFDEVHTDIPQPKDKGILLKDILESEVNEKYYLSEKMLKFCESNWRFSIRKDKDKSLCVTTKEGGRAENNFIMTQKYVQWDGNGFDQDNRAYFEDGKSGTLDVKANRQKVLFNNIICHNLMPRNGDPKKGGTGHLSRNDGKTYCLDTGQTNAIEIQTTKIRRLTPTECSRLQTIPDWYKWGCSNTQQYRMLGNGWTVDVIAHILSYLK